MSERFLVTPTPCSTCPYAKATPPGVWEAEEYERLRAWDEETFGQRAACFFCHSTPNTLCAGWVRVQGEEALGLRLAVAMGRVDPDDLETAIYWEDTVELYASGNEAADAGLAGLADPPPEAVKAVERILVRRNPRRKPSQ